MTFADKLASAKRGLTAVQKTLPYSEDLRRGLKFWAWLNWLSGAAAAGLVFAVCNIVKQLLA